MRGRGIGGGSIFQFTYLEAHVAHHGDPEPLDVCGDHVGVKVLGQYLVVNQCHGVHHFFGWLFWHLESP